MRKTLGASFILAMSLLFLIRSILCTVVLVGLFRHMSLRSLQPTFWTAKEIEQEEGGQSAVCTVLVATRYWYCTGKWRHSNAVGTGTVPVLHCAWTWTYPGVLLYHLVLGTVPVTGT